MVVNQLAKPPHMVLKVILSKYEDYIANNIYGEGLSHQNKQLQRWVHI